MADALEKLRKEAGSQKIISGAIGVRVDVFRDVMKRGSATRMSRQAFDRLVEALNLDVSKWGV